MRKKTFRAELQPGHKDDAVAVPFDRRIILQSFSTFRVNRLRGLKSNLAMRAVTKRLVR
jgi:hypothetical protein